jgi:hypothetical protein
MKLKGAISPTGSGECKKGSAMTKLQVTLVLATTFVGSMVGGMLSERLFGSGIVQAQKPNGVNAEEFLLLDQTGKARAGLGLDDNGEVGLILTSRDGNRKLAVSPDSPVVIKLSDRTGRILWSAP